MRGRTGLSAGQVTPSNMTRAKVADAKRDLCLVAAVEFEAACGLGTLSGEWQLAHDELVRAARAWAKAERVAGRLP